MNGRLGRTERGGHGDPAIKGGEETSDIRVKCRRNLDIHT